MVNSTVAILAITKHGISVGLELVKEFPKWSVYAPDKFANTYNNDARVKWYSDTTSSTIANLFAKYEGLVCLFSLGATIRLIAPHMKDKKTDPAVIVIDEMANYVISVLSGHIGGANKLTQTIAEKLNAQAVITTAADVKKTIAVDMIGRDYKWVIENDAAVTSVSAHMVNEEKIGIYQDAGIKIEKWYGKALPANVTTYDTLEKMYNSDAKSYLVITDKIIKTTDDVKSKMVIYRPPTLVVGIGLHYNTTPQTIMSGITQTFQKYELATKSIAKISSMKKPTDVLGLAQAADALDVPLFLYEKNVLAKITVPNPSDTVQSFEGTPSVSEASCLMAAAASSSLPENDNTCKLLVEKQKFPPDLTIAVAKREEEHNT